MWNQALHVSINSWDIVAKLKMSPAFLLKRLLSGPAYTISNYSNFSEIVLKNLDQLKMMGTVDFGTLHIALWLGFDVAKKAFHGHWIEGMDCINTLFLQEVFALNGLHHPIIVLLLWYGTFKPKYYIIMESKTKKYSITYSDQIQNQGIPRWMALEMVGYMA